MYYKYNSDFRCLKCYFSISPLLFLFLIETLLKKGNLIFINLRYIHKKDFTL